MTEDIRHPELEADRRADRRTYLYFGCFLFASFIVLLILIVMPITARISSSLESAGVAAEILRSCLLRVSRSVPRQI